MRVAITGAGGFVGGHLAASLRRDGHEVIPVGRSIGLDDAAALQRRFAGCDAVAHCAGINRQIGRQTYQRVHVQGTRNVVEAARGAGVGKIVLISFLRARPNCGSGYHESKWAAEQIVRGCGLDYTVLKPGVIYGRGDHMLDHLSRAFHTFPVFGLVGFGERPIRPIAVDDLVRILRAALADQRLSRGTFAVTGPEELTLGDAVRRVARAVGKRPLFVRLPIALHYAIARVCEWTMRIPMVSVAQVRILSEGLVDPAPIADELPADLRPGTRFTEEQIRAGLPEPGPFGIGDCRCCHLSNGAQA